MTGQPLEKAEQDRVAMRDRKSLLGTIIWCRHGATDYHPDRFYESEEGPHLSAEGLAQAEALGRWFAQRGRPVDALYVSATARTRETALPIERVLGIRAATRPDLGERDMGLWNGRLVEDVKRQDADAWAGWKTDPLRFVPPGGESLEAFGQRTETAVSELIAQHPGAVVAVVTHVGTIRAALCAALGCPLEYGKRFVIEPGSVTYVDYTTSWPNLVFMGVQPT